MLIEDVLGKNGVIANKLGAYELRPQQLDMALTIEKSIEDNKHLIVEAGTGVGKSMAYLIPFIFWTVKNRKRVIISTHTKTLQEQLTKKDLPFLRNTLRTVNTDTCQNNNRQEAGQKEGFDFSFALCVGGQNFLCIRRFNQARMHGLFSSRKEIEEFRQIMEWEERTENGLRSGLDFEPSQAVWGKICRESDLCFGKNCLFKDDCYYNKARRKEFKAQILVANHHLFFANLVNDGRVLPDFDAVVFDEAHTLEDVATSYLGLEISNVKVKFLLDSILNLRTGKGLITRLFESSNPSDKTIQAGGIKTTIEKILNETRSAGDLFFSEIIDKCGTGKKTTRIRKRGIVGNHLNKPLSDLSGILESLLNLVKTEEEKLEICAFASRCSEINHNISTILNQDLEEYVYWAEIENRKKPSFESFQGMLQITDSPQTVSNKETFSSASIHRQTRCSLFAAPINIAEEFKKRIFDKIKPVILTSATLSINGNFKYIKGRLGLSARHSCHGKTVADSTIDEEYHEKIIGSPFNFSENALIYIPDDIPDPNREPDEYRRNIIRHIKEMISCAQGRTFILFTSFEMLNAVYERFRHDASAFTLLRQGDKPRYQLVEEFKTGKSPVLFGTSTFWQGIDVPGEALKCVIITKLPFAVPSDPVIEARMELLKTHNKDPFMYYQVPQAITLLRQGFGRLIRTGTDTGVVAILDPRIKSRHYGRYFINSLPDCKKVSDIKEVKNFLNKRNPGILSERGSGED